MSLRLASLPDAITVGDPEVATVTVDRSRNRVLYGWSFTVGDIAYQVRAMRPAVTADPPTETDPYFALFECDPVCAETARLAGSMGTTGMEVRAGVPLTALGVEDSGVLTQVTASAALGEAPPGALVTLDEVDLPASAIPASLVELGIAPAEKPEEEVPYTAEADLVEGRFSGLLDISSLPGGGYRMWARACLGEACGARAVEVGLGTD